MDQFSNRLDRLREAVREIGMNGVLLVPGPNLRYFTGVNSLLLERPFFMAVPVDDGPHLVAPTLESGPYLRAPVKVTVYSWSDDEGPADAMQQAVNKLKMNGSWGVEGRVPYRFIHLLLKFAQPQLENADSVLEEIRSLKDPKEIQLLTRSAKILSKSFLSVPDMIKVGRRELDLAQELAREIHSNGAETVADVLIQSGSMSADAHHLPSSKKLKRKESVVVDAASTYGGYFADITRTFIVGRDSEFERLYESVLEAQVAAVEASRAGVTVGSVDEVARGRLRKQGLDSYFVHRTGHGLGLDVHEAPYVVPNGSELIRESMAFTIEPGVYMQGKTGVRIEDDLITTTRGNEVLTRSTPKEFGWWT
jgi:Xaa-Pro aminopeptidase